MTPLIGQLLSRMKRAGLNAQSLSRKAGLNDNAVRDIIGGKSRNPRSDTLQKIADALGTTVADLMQEQAPSAGRLEQIIVRGFVQAGAWREAAEWTEDDWYTVTVPPSKRFPRLNRYALEVRGTSMDRLYPDGTVVLCIRFADLARLPKHGEKVVCLRRNRVGQIEATLKEFALDDRGGAWLWPRSNDPEFHEPIRLPVLVPEIAADFVPIPKQVRAGHVGDDETEALEIVALVVGSYREEDSAE